MTAPAWCLYDTGVRAASENLALDRQLLAACLQGTHHGSLRLHRFLPSVSVGRHEDIARAVRRDYCAAHDIEVTRRLTGGGALYLDPQQFCFSLVFSLAADWRSLSLHALIQELTEHVACALQELGVDARYVFPNDLEVSGRKLGSTFIFREGDCVLFQGSLLLGITIETLLSALRLPTEKLSPQGMRTARERLTTLDECRPGIGEAALVATVCRHLGAALNTQFVPNTLEHAPRQPEIEIDAPARPEAWTAFVKTAGGTTYVEVLAHAGHIEIVRFSGSMHVHPAGVLKELAAQLVGVAVGQAEQRTLAWLASMQHDFVGMTAADVARVLRLALDRGHEQEFIGLDTAQANALMVHSPTGSEPADSILAQAGAMLVPYCAKPVWCKWRHRDGCTECGQCEVGDAYRMARERGMRVVTVTNYEHLTATLAQLRADGVASYVGMCCGNFYLKRQQAFSDAGLPAVLMDISGSNCYELRQEDQAYAGKFEAQAKLRLDVIEKVMSKVPGRTPDDAEND